MSLIGRSDGGCRAATGRTPRSCQTVTRRALGGWIPWGVDQEENLVVAPPDGSPMLGGLQQASVVGHDLMLGQVQVELQCHQDRELEGYQLPAVHSEPFLQFLPKE